jgi:hypothetical protein
MISKLIKMLYVTIKEMQITQQRDAITLLEWPKYRTLTILNAGEDVEHENCNSLLVRGQNEAVTLEDGLVVS